VVCRPQDAGGVVAGGSDHGQETQGDTYEDDFNGQRKQKRQIEKDQLEISEEYKKLKVRLFWKR